MQTIRISLPTIDALEVSPDPRDYSLLADDDNILIKEHSRGSITNGANITHDLGYLPHFYVYGEVSGRMQIANGHNLFGPWKTLAYEDVLQIFGTGECRYFIFYDDIPAV